MSVGPERCREEEEEKGISRSEERSGNDAALPLSARGRT